MPTSIHSDSSFRAGMVSGSGPLAKLQVCDCLSVKISRTPGASRCVHTKTAGHAKGKHTDETGTLTRRHLHHHCARPRHRITSQSDDCRHGGIRTLALAFTKRTWSLIVPEKWTVATRNMPEAGCAPVCSCCSLAEPPASVLGATSLLRCAQLSDWVALREHAPGFVTFRATADPDTVELHLSAATKQR